MFIDQLPGNGRAVDIDADEDEFLTAVAELGVPAVADDVGDQRFGGSHLSEGREDPANS